MGLTPGSVYVVTGGGGGFALASFRPTPDSALWIWVLWIIVWAAAIYLFVRGVLGFLALMVQRGWIAREMFRQRGLPRIRIKVEWPAAKSGNRAQVPPLPKSADPVGDARKALATAEREDTERPPADPPEPTGAPPKPRFRVQPGGDANGGRAARGRPGRGWAD